MEDDKKYIQLMDRYKRLRLTDHKAAQLYLDAAVELRERGRVSEEATLGGAYL